VNLKLDLQQIRVGRRKKIPKNDPDVFKICFQRRQVPKKSHKSLPISNNRHVLYVKKSGRVMFSRINLLISCEMPNEASLSGTKIQMQQMRSKVKAK
jgi:hypothetical protein